VAEKLPAWSDRALQGLVFWIGHRRSLYPHHKLGESALVAELCNLASANLETGKTVSCEVHYQDMVPTGKKLNGLGDARADLVIAKGVSYKELEDHEELLAKHAEFVVEVKRAGGIDGDLRRLASLIEKNKNLRAFLFVIYEADKKGHKYLKKFVDAEGNAIRKKFAIKDEAKKSKNMGHYSVRRVVKASASFAKKERAHYALIIEVFNA